MRPPFHFESVELAVDTVVDAVEVAGLPWCLAILEQGPEAASHLLYFVLAWTEAGHTRLSSATSTTTPTSIAPWLVASRQQDPGDDHVIYREIDLAATARDAGLPSVPIVERSTAPALFPLRSRLGSVAGYLLTEREALDSSDGRGQALLGMARRLVNAIDRFHSGGATFSETSSLDPSAHTWGPAGFPPRHDVPRDRAADQEREALPPTSFPFDHVRSIARHIASADTFDSALSWVLQGVRELTGAETSELWFPIDADAPRGRQRVYRRLDEGPYRWDDEPSIPHNNLDESRSFGQIPSVARSGDSTPPSDDARSSSPRSHDQSRHASAISVPLRSQGRVLGTLRAGKESRHGFQPRDLEVLRTLADLAGSAAAQRQIQSQADGLLKDRDSPQDAWVADWVRLAEAERLAQARLAATFQVTDTVVLTFNAAGIIESLAGNAEAITGWKPEELVGYSLLELFPIDGRHEVVKSFQSWGAGRDDPVGSHLSLLHRSGRLVPVHLAAKPHIVAGTFVSGAGTLTDLSTLTLLRNELDTARTLQARFQGAVRTGRAVAHELGSPISTIMALTELLTDEPTLPPDIVADLGTLRREALRASDLLHQFGRISRYAEVATPVGPQLDVGTASGRFTDDGSPPASQT